MNTQDKNTQDKYQDKVKHFAYSASNPPESREMAQARYEELCRDLSSIDNQLKATNQDCFESLVEFRGWRRRAFNALEFKKVEKKFLTKWLESDARPTDDPMQAVPTDLGAVETIKAFMTAQLQEYGWEDYQPLFSTHNPPDSQVVAESRKRELVSKHVVLSTVLREVKSLAVSGQYRADDVKVAKTYFVDLIKSMESELAWLRMYISSKCLIGKSVKGTDSRAQVALPTHRPEDAGYKLLSRLLVITERLYRMRGISVSGHSKLTAEEMEVLQAVRQFVGGADK